ncbi:hypothetical protein [Sorangium sp. So ce693]|uniref:hypothetical protein n=1 Tax=Sorangium sp. So ce693 TaxID=3133318 RepID=UPI003F5D789A
MNTRWFEQVLLALTMTLSAGCAAEALSDEEQSEVVGEAEEAISVFSFSRSATNNATVNTANFNLTINPNRRVMIGTTGIVGASSSGDTYLRLFDLSSGSPVEVASANDGPSGSISAQIRYTTSATGWPFQIRAGCDGFSSCSGTVAIARGKGTFSYSRSSTNYATTNYVEQAYFFNAGETISFGTCSAVLYGASRSGMSYIRLFDRNGVQVAVDSAETIGCSEMPKTTHVAALSDYYTFRAGCVGNTSCTATVAVYAE